MYRDSWTVAGFKRELNSFSGVVIHKAGRSKLVFVTVYFDFNYVDFEGFIFINKKNDAFCIEYSVEMNYIITKLLST